MTSGKSAARHSRTALPLSAVSIRASRSRFSSMMSAILRRMVERSETEALDQDSLKVVVAASTAAPMSLASPRAAWQSTVCPSIGDTLSKYFPLVGSTNSPPMKWPYLPRDRGMRSASQLIGTEPAGRAGEDASVRLRPEALLTCAEARGQQSPTSRPVTWRERPTAPRAARGLRPWDSASPWPPRRLSAQGSSTPSSPQRASS